MPYGEIEAYQETPGMTALGAIPGVGVGMAFNQQRSGRTLMSGLGKSGAYRNTATLGAAARNTLNPRNFSRLGSYDALFDKPGKYSPYILAGVGNAAANAIGMTGAAGKNPAYMNAKSKAVLFGRGTLARSGAMNKIALGAEMAGVEKFLTAASDEFYKPKNLMQLGSSHGGFVGNIEAAREKGRLVGGTTTGKFGSRADVGLRIAASSQGFYSQKFLAYQSRVTIGKSSQQAERVTRGISGVRAGSTAAVTDLSRAGLDVVDGSLMRGGQTVSARAAIMGAESGARFSAAKVVGARGLGATAGLMGGPLGAAATVAMLGYDLGQLAGAGIKGVINTIGDAAESLQGSMNKPIFGMGFKDTQFAATSRARGVMAIQNSRLNARSAMGSEAGMMAAHFG
jgi:hypothetical protein